MSSPTFKNFVGSRRVHTREVRNVANTVQCTEATGNLFLSTASWPELPKSQNAQNRKTSNTIEKKKPSDIRTCNQSSTSVKTVKSTKEFSGNSVMENKMTEMDDSLVPSHSEGTRTENFARSDNGNKDKLFRERIEKSSSDSNQIAATGIESSGLSNGTYSNRNQRKKANKRNALKEEKKRMREAEFLRKRIEPKGQSVKVISHKLLEMVLKSDKHSISVNSQQKCDITGLNFPTLEEATKNKSIKECLPCSSDSNENCSNEINPVDSTVISRKNKFKKPLEISIHNLIKDSSRKSSDKGCRSNKGHPHLKAKQNVPCIGNQLDSSNPERKRGKKRERPKKKRFTLLKTAILEARAIRKHLRELEEQSKNAADTPEVQFWNKELNEPVKIHLQHTQTLPFEGHDYKEETVKCEAIEKENLSKKTSTAEVKKTEVELLQEMSIPKLTPKRHSRENASNFHQSKSLNVNLCSKTAPKSSEKNKHLVLEEVQLSAQKFLQHSRKFREYCDHILTKDLDNAVKSLIENIVKFQDRLYQRDPIKAFAKRRYVVGFREVKKHLQLKRLKLIIIAPDLEVAKTKGGTDDAVAELKDMSNLQCLPYVFAMNRRALGYVTLKKVGVSCIGVINYEGAENTFTSIIEAVSVARMQYNKLVNNETAIASEKEEPEETKDKVEISACIAASLLAKLREKSAEDETHCKDKSSPFLAAIDRVIKSKDCTE